MSDSLLGTLFETDTGGTDFNMMDYAGVDSTDTTGATIDTSGNVSSPSLWDQVSSGISDAFGAVVAGVKTGATGTAWTALTAAKSAVLSSTASALAARPDVQAAAKTTAGNKLGNWIMTNWKTVAFFGLVIGGGLFFYARRR